MNKATQPDGLEPPATDPAPMTPAKGFLVLMALVVVIAAFLVLSHTIGVTETWAAFLFLLYWAGIDHADFGKLPAAIVGGVMGLLMVYLMQQAPLWLGTTTGGAVLLGAVLLLVYCQIMGWLPIAVNMMTMLYLTVGSAPVIQAAFQLPGTLAALALSVTYFAGLVWVGSQVQKMRSAKA